MEKNKTLNNQDRYGQWVMHKDVEALNAYLFFLRSKGVAHTSLAQRVAFLKVLIAGLAARPYDRVAYASALNGIMKKTRDHAWHFHMQIAREFYPFWMQDIKAIAALSEQYTLDKQMVDWAPMPRSLKDLSEMLQKMAFSEVESAQLEQYLNGMRQLALPKDEMVVNLKLAKIMLIRLRDAPQKNGSLYRVAVDMTLPLFRLKNSRQQFLEVVREFFPYWIAPQAAQPQSDQPQATQ